MDFIFRFQNGAHALLYVVHFSGGPFSKPNVLLAVSCSQPYLHITPVLPVLASAPLLRGVLPVVPVRHDERME